MRSPYQCVEDASTAEEPLGQSGSARIVRIVAKVITSVFGCNGDTTKPRDR
jgi:hypothetical protein